MEKIKINKTSFNLEWLKANRDELDHGKVGTFSHIPQIDIAFLKEKIKIYDDCSKGNCETILTECTRESDRYIDGGTPLIHSNEQESVVKRYKGKRRGDKTSLQHEDSEKEGAEDSELV